MPSALLVLWLIVVTLSLGKLVETERDRVATAFASEFDHLARDVQRQLLQNDLALEAFRAYLTASPQPDLNRTRIFTRLLFKQYPNIYMFEIAQRITSAQRAGLEERMRAAGYKDFTIHEFGYDSDRRVHAAGDQPNYQPIIFIDPELANTREVLGLDLNSTSGVLGEAAHRTYGTLEKVSTAPFRLLEGGHGYLIYAPVMSADSGPGQKLHLKNGLFALVMVKTESLLPAWVKDEEQQEGLTVRLQRASTPAVPAVPIASVSHPSDEAWGLDYLFEPLHRRVQVGSRSQPFELVASYRVCWDEVELSTFVSFAFTTLLTLLLAIYASSLIYRRRLQAQARRETLYARANFDLTTELPNRYLLEDRVEQAIRQARRENNSLALVFVDLDRFKAVNDHWGHAMGDEVLRAVGQRISAAVREADSVGRLHGDEFLVLLRDIDETLDVQSVVDKISHVLDSPLVIHGNVVALGMSIGTALFPQDGKDFATLLRTSDKRMYATKHRARSGPSA